MQGRAATLLYDRRKALGLTQHDVATAAGVRDYDISRWERGQTRSLPTAKLAKVCRVLNLDLEKVADALIADEDARQPRSNRNGVR